MVKIKICGITSKKDAFLAVDAGVDALGFIFAKSTRQVSPQLAKEIIEALPPFIERVGVFVNEKLHHVLTTVRFCLLSSCQLHGDELPHYCSQLPCKLIKSFSVRDKVPEKIADYRGKIDACLLDSFCEEKRGGTVKVFDWEIACEVKKIGFPLILSGGLNAANVTAAIRRIHPYAVDVASGVEDAPGKKSREKMQEFIDLARRAQ